MGDQLGAFAGNGGALTSAPQRAGAEAEHGGNLGGGVCDAGDGFGSGVRHGILQKAGTHSLTHSEPLAQRDSGETVLLGSRPDESLFLAPDRPPLPVLGRKGIGLQAPQTDAVEELGQLDPLVRLLAAKETAHPLDIGSAQPPGVLRIEQPEREPGPTSPVIAMLGFGAVQREGRPQCFVPARTGAGKRSIGQPATAGGLRTTSSR